MTDDLPYLRHILDAIELIESYTRRLQTALASQT